MERIVEFLADESYQFIGIAKFPALRHARGQVSSQRNHMTDTSIAVFLQHFAYVFAGCANTGKMGCGHISLCLNFQYRLESTVTGGSARTEGHGKEFRIELRQLSTSCAQLLDSFRRLWGEKLEAESGGKLFL